TTFHTWTPNKTFTGLIQAVTPGPAIGNEQVPTTNWTPSQTYRSMTQASTSGSGTGMTVDIVVGQDGIPVATLASFGTGSVAGDTVTFNPPDNVADPLTVQVVRAFAGTGMTADITVDQYSHPHATITNQGAGYHIGDLISFTAPDNVGSPVNVQ